MLREYRIPGARFSILKDLLLVQYRSGSEVTLRLGDDAPMPYRGKGPVWIEVDDGTGKQPTFSGTVPAPADDDFGVVLTELSFRGDVTAKVDSDDPNVLLVQASGEPKIVGGREYLPATANDMSAFDRITWASTISDGNPHPPKASAKV